MGHVDSATLAAGLGAIEAAPADRGSLEMIVRRPANFERETVDTAELTLDLGLVGDNWLERGSRHTEDGSAEHGRQLTLMNARAIDLFAGGDKARWPEAGDQLFVDFSLAETNVPAGTRLVIGGAVIEVSELPHTGCAKFLKRFGRDVTRFVNTTDGQRLHVRGINAFVVTPGTVRTGDAIVKL